MGILSEDSLKGWDKEEKKGTDSMNPLVIKLKGVVATRKGLKKRAALEWLAREIGVSYNTIWRWMNGKCQPSLMAQDRIRKFLQYKG